MCSLGFSCCFCFWAGTCTAGSVHWCGFLPFLFFWSGDFFSSVMQEAMRAGQQSESKFLDFGFCQRCNPWSNINMRLFVFDLSIKYINLSQDSFYSFGSVTCCSISFQLLMEQYFQGFCVCFFSLVVHFTYGRLCLLTCSLLCSPVGPQKFCLASRRMPTIQDQTLHDGPTQQHNLTSLPLIPHPDSTHGRQSSLLLLKTHRPI